jgi:hypothetical protein
MGYNLLQSPTVSLRYDIGIRDKDWTFKQIAGWLNNNGYTSARGKKFGPSNVHSIIKKRRLRNQRMSKESKVIISNFDLWFLDRTLINQI